MKNLSEGWKTEGTGSSSISYKDMLISDTKRCVSFNDEIVRARRALWE